MNDMKNFMKEAARVIPSARQLRWFDMDSYAFIHFGMNTFTDREWGTGKEKEEIFAPTDLDCDQWVKTIRDAGMKGMVLVAKHHDGFCLWDTKYTRHSVMYSPIRRDIVREAADACRRGGIRFGFYLSPWDRNSPLYGTDAYNDYFCAQLTELLTEYGDIFYVWFDNACGEGPNGRKQNDDFPRYIDLIRKYQPDAVIFNDFGPDVRWCGNEAGSARSSEWAVVPQEMCRYAVPQTAAGPLADEGSLGYLYNTNAQIGDLSQILYSGGLAFVPSEINTSIRSGWFWHEREEPKSLEELFRVYLASVGGNACLNLNLPPDRRGKIDARDVKRLQEFREFLDHQFGAPLPVDVSRIPSGYPTQPVYRIQLKEPGRAVRYVVLEEDLSQGQRIESFQIEAASGDGNLYPFYQGTTVGHRKICALSDPFTGQNPLTRTIDWSAAKELILRVTAARDEVHMRSVRVF